MPTAASYLREPGDDIYRAFKFDVLRIVDGQIAEITTFGPALFAQFGLPEALNNLTGPSSSRPRSTNSLIDAQSMAGLPRRLVGRVAHQNAGMVQGRRDLYHFEWVARRAGLVTQPVRSAEERHLPVVA